MNRTIEVLVIAGGLVGAFFVYEDYAAKQKEKHNHFAEDIGKIIRDQRAENQMESQTGRWFADDGAFYRILGLIHDGERHKYSPGETVKNGVSLSGLRPGEGKMVIDMLVENHRIARQMGVFDDMSNQLRLERGEAPICQAKGWEDEPLAVGRVLSPLVAPEASLSLANLVLMPKTMRDLQSNDLSGFTPDMAKKWLSERIITPESHQAIMDILASKKF